MQSLFAEGKSSQKSSTTEQILWNTVAILKNLIPFKETCTGKLQVNSPNELACCSLTAFVSLPLISKFVITSVLTTSSLGETYKKDKPNAARH